jgi:hypothetical protein
MINGRYYCQTCLFDAVLDGTVTGGQGRNCSNCDDPISDGMSSYCGYCYENAGEGNPNACDNCGDEDAEVLCSDCRSESHICGECGNYTDTLYTYCDTCQDKLIACSGCGDNLTCASCNARETAAIAAQPVTTDGAQIEFDDGVVINFDL